MDGEHCVCVCVWVHAHKIERIMRGRRGRVWSIPVLIHRSRGGESWELRASLHPSEPQGVRCLATRTQVLQTQCVQRCLFSFHWSGGVVACATARVLFIVSEVFSLGNTR